MYLGHTSEGGKCKSQFPQENVRITNTCWKMQCIEKLYKLQQRMRKYALEKLTLTTLHFSFTI